MKNYSTFLVIFLFAFSAYCQWEPGDPITDSRDGQSYRTVVIGNQVWMAENLNIGGLIPTTKAGAEMSDNNEIEKYCWDNDVDNCNGAGGKMKRGGFYEWEEAMQYWNGQPALPVRGICPEGWHIPSNAEWNEFFAYLGASNPYTKMLDGGESGFDALLTGYRCTMSGSFRVSATSADTRTYFWTSEQTDFNNAPILELGATSLSAFSFLKSVGLCIRCLWDSQSSDINEDNGMNKFEIKVSPNPFCSEKCMYYSLNRNYPVNAEITIVDYLGNEIAQIHKGIIHPGIHNYQFINNNLPSGMYFIIAKLNTKLARAPLLVIN